MWYFGRVICLRPLLRCEGSCCCAPVEPTDTSCLWTNVVAGWGYCYDVDGPPTVFGVLLRDLLAMWWQVVFQSVLRLLIVLLPVAVRVRVIIVHATSSRFQRC